jgi:predicted nucleic acid-binding protein
MALAKVDGLGALFLLYPKVSTPPGVYEETVTAGLRLGVPDADALDRCYRDGSLEVLAPALPSLPTPSSLGRGEEECIRLAVEHRADWLLIDDLEARRAAQLNFQSAGVGTQIKGTLGILVSACQEGRLPKREAIRLVEALSQRADIWVSASLCRRLIEILEKEG